MTITGIDPGDIVTGIALVVGGVPLKGYNIPNADVFSLVAGICIDGESTVVIEDMRAYEGTFSQRVIDTCKFIGELQYRFKTAGIRYVLVPRSTIKTWLYSSQNELVKPLVEQRIRQRKLINKSGEYRLPSFIFINDRIVASAMRHIHQLKKPKPGKKLESGLIHHAIQALAAATYYLQIDSNTGASLTISK